MRNQTNNIEVTQSELSFVDKLALIGGFDGQEGLPGHTREDARLTRRQAAGVWVAALALTAAGFVGFNNAQNRVEKASQKGL